MYVAKTDNHYLGIDIGSVSLSYVLLDQKGHILKSETLFHQGNIFQALKEKLAAIDLSKVHQVVYNHKSCDFFTSGMSINEQVALIDFNDWLGLRLGAGISVWHLFIVLLTLITAYFLFKEAIPSLRHYFERRYSLPTIEPGQFPKLDSILAKLSEIKGLPIPTVLLSAKDTPVIHTMGRQALVLSTTTINMLDSEELEVVIAHELAHLTRQAHRVSQAALALRFLMFYNPVALLVSRRIINDNEKNCDDIAVHITGRQLALASGLLKVFHQIDASLVDTSSSRSRILPRINALEDRAYRYLIKERVERLVHPDKASDLPYQSFRVLLTAGLLAALLFFVV